MTPDPTDFYVSTERARLDLRWLTHTLLNTGWGKAWTHELIAEAVRNSQVVFGLYEHRVPTDGAHPISDSQIGFARVVTDYATFSWLADVVIDPAYRRRGLGKFLVRQIAAHPVVAKTPTLLRTRDAADLYAKVGFVQCEAMRRLPLAPAP
jgi:GNAT superfamily N-acetyltransferase